MTEEEKNYHQHEHGHSEEVHNHQHKHDEVSHEHPHFHPELLHTHLHKHPFSLKQIRKVHLHEHAEAHYHPHTYSFERYNDLVSPIHKLDPRIKILAFFTLIVVIALTSPMEYTKFTFYFSLIAVMILLSKIPWSFVLKRSAVIVPFVLLVVVFAPFASSNTISGSINFGVITIKMQGLLIVWNVLIKSWLSVLTLILLSCSTRFSLLLKGFERLKAPSIIIVLISFLYRFNFVFGDELLRTIRGYKARSFGARNNLKVLGNALGSFFVRSYERGERIYLAMIARGFEGEIKTLDCIKLRIQDLLFFLFFISVLGLIYLWRF